MEETQKCFVCSVEGCSKRFTNLENLNVHRKKHDMVLNLGNGQKSNVFVADQTPTPTRFIRNCEEVGLFQDLQNVNPFEETFRKAVEASKMGGSLLEVQTLHVPAASDDTLHTPHVFPNITEDHGSMANLVSSTSVVEADSGAKSPAREELETLPTILECEPTIIEVPNPVIEDTAADLDTDIEIDLLANPEVLIKEEADSSLQMPSRASSVDSGCKIPLSTQDTVQVVFHMPDGRLVQLSGLSMDNIPSTQLPVQVPSNVVQGTALPQSSNQNAVIINTQFAATQIAQISSDGQQRIISLPTTNNNITSAVPTTDLVNSPQERLSAAKMKLKMRIQCNSKRKQSPSKEIESISPASKKGSTVLQTPHTSLSEGSDTNVSPNSRVKKSTNSSTDVDEQKLKFRERNRAAAMRCREKRKYWIMELEKRADETQRLNQQLTAEVTNLRTELMQLKTLLLAHKDCSVTKAMQQGIAVTRSGSAIKTSPVTQIQVQQPVVSIPQVPMTIPTNVKVCASTEETHRKVVLLGKPSGLKQRRQAALPALAVIENGTLQSSGTVEQIEQFQRTQVISVSQPASLKTTSSDSNNQSNNMVVSSTDSGELKSNLATESVSASSKTCYITVTAPTFISAGVQNLAIKGPLTSTSYLMPTKLCLPATDSLPQVIKYSSNVIKPSASDVVKRNNLTHSNGDSMDSGHGSDIEILAEIPNRLEENR